jgi:hypothetical protein
MHIHWKYRVQSVSDVYMSIANTALVLLLPYFAFNSYMSNFLQVLRL